MSPDPHVLGPAHPPDRRHQRGQKARIRALVAVTLIVFWALAALSGLLLAGAPAGPRSGAAILFILTKAQWGEVHFWVSIAASVVTSIHIAIDWKALMACVRFLTSPERRPLP